MWKYLAFNAALFFILFTVNATGKRAARHFVSGSILIGAGIVAARSSVDPLAYLFYVSSICIVFFSFYQFRGRNAARAMHLDFELGSLAHDYASERKALTLKEDNNKQLEEKHSRIMYLYDKTKEMSQSLDVFEAFLIFGEALYHHFDCGPAKLVVLEYGESGAPEIKEAFSLNASDFRGVFDRTFFMNDPNKRKTQVYPFEMSVLDLVIQKKSVITGADLPSLKDPKGSEILEKRLSFSAFPIFVDQRVSSVLFLTEIDNNDQKVISILIGRFLWEIQRVELYKHVETLAITDGLTGVAVRRHLLERFEREVDRSKRFGFKLSFLMIDIDHFKNFNDHYGHLVGDAVLKQVAETIKLSIRELDLLGRYGGEEFGALLIETDASTAFFIAQRIRQAVDERIFKAYGENLKVTISVGCSTYSQNLNSVGLLVDSADSALYQAKRQGRNKVCAAELLDAPEGL